MAGHINGQRAEVVHPGVLRLFGQGAGQHSLHPGHQLPRAEGLHHIVVRAAFQPGQLIVLPAAGRQHNDRGGHFAAAHLPQAGHAVHKGHHHIQDHQVDAAHRQLGQGGAAVGGLVALIACMLQMLPDQFPDAGFVVHNQDFSHVKNPSRIVCRCLWPRCGPRAGKPARRPAVFLRGRTPPLGMACFLRAELAPPRSYSHYNSTGCFTHVQNVKKFKILYVFAGPAKKRTGRPAGGLSVRSGSYRGLRGHCFTAACTSENSCSISCAGCAVSRLTTTSTATFTRKAGSSS